jgi:hypothetical protein
MPQHLLHVGDRHAAIPVQVAARRFPTPTAAIVPHAQPVVGHLQRIPHPDQPISREI